MRLSELIGRRSVESQSNAPNINQNLAVPYWSFWSVFVQSYALDMDGRIGPLESVLGDTFGLSLYSPIRWMWTGA